MMEFLFGLESGIIITILGEGALALILFRVGISKVAKQVGNGS